MACRWRNIYNMQRTSHCPQRLKGPYVSQNPLDLRAALLRPVEREFCSPHTALLMNMAPPVHIARPYRVYQTATGASLHLLAPPEFLLIRIASDVAE
jgi:hypothetical protein